VSNSLSAETPAVRDLLELYRFYVRTETFTAASPAEEALLDFGLVTDARNDGRL
jgi:hypothetical protein